MPVLHLAQTWETGWKQKTSALLDDWQWLNATLCENFYETGISIYSNEFAKTCNGIERVNKHHVSAVMC